MVDNTNKASRRKFHFIYKTTCKVTNKYYIGMHSTDDICDGYLGSGRRLRRSVKKYGKENHVREILEHCCNRKHLTRCEKKIIIQEVIDDPLCMNIQLGGEGGALYTKQMKEKMSKIIEGKKRSEKTKQRMSKAQKGKKKSKEHKQKISKANKGKKRSEEAKQKMSEGAKRRWNDPEYRKKQSEIRKMQWNDPEYRKKQSDGLKRRWNDPEYRKRQTQSGGE